LCVTTPYIYLYQEENKARKHVRDARDFNNIETLAVIRFFSPAKQGAEGNSRHFWQKH